MEEFPWFCSCVEVFFSRIGLHAERTGSISADRKSTQAALADVCGIWLLLLPLSVFSGRSGARRQKVRGTGTHTYSTSPSVVCAIIGKRMILFLFQVPYDYTTPKTDSH
jgi:hypothetical protein